MGMDVSGRKPTGERGIYFGNNSSWWHPLADYCIAVAPDICAPCTHWHSNDGDGLDAAGAAALAKALQKEIGSGRTETYARRYASDQQPMPDEPCVSCLIGRVPSVLFAGGRQPLRINCNECHGTGFCRPGPSFSTENIWAFIGFLRQSGGFAIW